MRQIDNPKENLRDTSPRVLKHSGYTTHGKLARVPDRDGRKLSEQHLNHPAPTAVREHRNLGVGKGGVPQTGTHRKQVESIAKARLDLARKQTLTTAVTQDELKTLTNARAELEAQARHKKVAKPKPKKFGKSSTYGSKPKLKK